MIRLTLPLVLYILPAVTVLTLLVPQKRKPLVLALGGLACVWLTGGSPALILLMCMTVSAWLVLRLLPVQQGAQGRRIKLRMYAGICLQFLFPVLGRLFLPGRAALLPLLILAMQNTEYICDRANKRVSIPGLFPFFCYSAEMPRLFAGPPLQADAAATMWQQRKQTAENLGSGAALYIRGLFQVTCLALPMQQLHRALSELIPEKTLLDEWLTVMVYYFMLYFSLKGAAQLGQGIAQMTGLIYPDSFDSPILAGTHYGFWTRFMVPVSAWAKRVLFPQHDADTGSYFARMLLIFCGIGLTVGSGICGLLWGICCALLLTAEHLLNPKWIAQIPIAARRVIVAVTLLIFLGMLRCGSLQQLVTFYSGFFGERGLAFSNTTGYLIKNYWFLILICIAALFPVRKTVTKHMEKNIARRIAAEILTVVLEFGMLAMSMAELMSSYLRG
ncbi:MAG: hypothetical protein IJ060_02480 [Oscillospiraceae bacterium]|nr:hypothetical protein [Oscillospiraceae bacterium]